MSRPRIVLIAAITAVVLGAGVARAQLVITDPAVTLRNVVIAVLKRQVLDTLTQQADRFQRMAKRLSASTNLDKYALTDDDIPMWRIHLFQGEQFLYANPFNAALNYGDGSGAGYEDVARSRTDPGAELTGLAELAPAADAAIVAGLATLDAADSTMIAGTDQTGQLRYNGRRELAAIDALQGDALDPSPSQSATAVLDKITGADLIRARQQQARIQFIGAIVEQLLVDNKRARDTEAATMNMQLERLRWGRMANTSLVAGAADALRTWRQP
jgi:hypothetical protein